MPINGSIEDKDDPPSKADEDLQNVEKTVAAASEVADMSPTTYKSALPMKRSKRLQDPEHEPTQAIRPRHQIFSSAPSSSVQKPLNETKEPSQSPDVFTTQSTQSMAQNPRVNHPSGSYGSTHNLEIVTEEPVVPDEALPSTKVIAVIAAAGVSGWSHQVLAPHKAEAEDHTDEDEWQDMPAFAPFDLYDDDGKLIAKEARDSDDEVNVYAGLGGAGKGYTRVQVDEDARSTTSMDDNTSYLFKNKGTDVIDEDEELRDPMAQMQTTKDLLTETQRIAYVGVTRLAMVQMAQELDTVEVTKNTKKEIRVVLESLKMWSQQMMLRLYAHMEISSSGI